MPNKVGYKGVMYNVTSEQWDAYHAQRKLEDKQRQERSAFWRDFWITVMKNNGLTNKEIAEIFEVTPSTVSRNVRRLQS